MEENPLVTSIQKFIYSKQNEKNGASSEAMRRFFVVLLPLFVFRLSVGGRCDCVLSFESFGKDQGIAVAAVFRDFVD